MAILATILLYAAAAATALLLTGAALIAMALRATPIPQDPPADGWVQEDE